jgi:hypothetical protein
LKFKGNDIPNLTIANSLKYLGMAISGRRKVKLEAVQAKQKEMESKLLTVQKIDVIKTFLLPTLDFTMLNVDIGKKQLMRMDKRIRAEVDPS